ncbi:class I alpha-mannosidase-like protein [Lineolata rhizophorae]|uniref:alpha-1,2-Mannosidase n=1 Tax=Lineolata rhizophorae TaxID=578093 RepID=A0A6A6NY94_9PEZI|nr:class I alpha-mannosidase-like protein [Lineolata rhizophorae]
MLPQRNPVTSMTPLPTGLPLPLPRIQHDFAQNSETWRERYTREKRQATVKHSFEHAWNGYKKHAWMQDEVMPVSGSFRNVFGGWGATMVDSLDTLAIMGLDRDFELVLDALDDIDFSSVGADVVNVFETTIRYLGGLLSAYDLTDRRHSKLLEKAKEIGDMLYVAFDTPNRMPVPRWRWKNGALSGPQESPSQVLLAELGSLSLEFTRLSQLTRNPKYYDAIQRISDELEASQNKTRIPGLWPMTVNGKKMMFTADRTFTFGGMADSLYEYLAKEFMLLGGLHDQYRRMYEFAIDTAKKYLFFRPLNEQNAELLLAGTARGTVAGRVKLDPQAQHLACFTGGMVGIGARLFDRPEDLSVARQLTDGCIWAYESMPAGVMPEIFWAVPCGIDTTGDEGEMVEAAPESCEWSVDKWMRGVREFHNRRAGPNDVGMTETGAVRYSKKHRLAPGFTDISDGRYNLRPEAIESVFIMYRITGDRTLQDKAWEMFSAIDEATRTNVGNAGLKDVTSKSNVLLDNCESFWTAETLKYFYLIFAEPDVVSLDDFVFNTEAHPLKRPSVGS